MRLYDGSGENGNLCRVLSLALKHLIELRHRRHSTKIVEFLPPGALFGSMIRPRTEEENEIER